MHTCFILLHHITCIKYVVFTPQPLDCTSLSITLIRDVKHDFPFIKDIINLYFTKFAVICLSPSISPSNQHINGCFILTENWYALPMVFFLLLGTQNKMTRYHILKYLGPKACQSTCSYLFWLRNI